MDELIKNKYLNWVEKATADTDVASELKNIECDDDKIFDAFYRDLEFGTGGLRGVIGAGTNRMNVHTVAKASQGLANYIVNNFEENERKIAVSYDSRIKSDLFAKVSAEIFAGNGIDVFIYSELMPTPCLSFAVRELGCCTGIMITASHNPGKYNGYKVYGKDGCQITTEMADEVYGEIKKIDEFSNVVAVDFDVAKAEGLIQYIKEDVYTAFIENVKAQSVLTAGDVVDKNVGIVYSPLNGTGLKPVLRALKESGFTNITVVKEQEHPDGNFPTCPYPNPEIKEALALGLEYAKKHNADLMLTTDPDCDRVGIAVKDKNGEHVLLSGNEVGMLLLDYICDRRIENNTMPKDPVVIKTIVTIDMAERIAADYGVKTIDVLTGFKFIGEQIGLLENAGKANSYILGFEESYGYLTGSYVRDKDAVNGTHMICEMFAFHKSRGKSLLDKLDELYAKYGYCLNTLHSYEFEGAEGFAKMQDIMKDLRQTKSEIGGKKISKIIDYAEGINGLPKSNVLKFLLEDNCSMVVRPSGTEPKLKIYMSVSVDSVIDVDCVEECIGARLLKYFIDDKCKLKRYN